jgi:hypothetical protein
MSNYKWASLLAVLLVALCWGQTPSSAPEPTVVGVVFFLDQATQTLKQLPGEDWKRKNKAGLRAVESIDVVTGQHSPLRISSADKIAFVYKPFNPQEVVNVQLFAFTQVKGDRETVMGKTKGRNTEYNPSIPLDVTQFGTSSYKLTPRSPLSPGEYWVSTPGRGQIHTFGID